ncbi:MAG TPA: hypothetical protein VK831_00010 [Candidatus Deferrimicrobiaceae bacterium]|nr:hypothetical protein [Candidatus Deferrimicrobiaceae bacterium]
MHSPAPLHPISRRHLEALTGELGIFQHAIGSTPDPAHGYCVDDVARALQVDLLHARELGWEAVADSAWRGVRVLEAAFDDASGRFRNFRSIDGEWIGGKGSDDCHGRAMLALGETVAAAPDPALAAAALTLFGRALRAAERLSSPRAQASVVLGCAALSGSRTVTESTLAADVTLGAASTAVLRSLATGLHARFLAFARPGWPWPEDTLTYENAVLPRAMIVAGQRLGAVVMQRIGLQVLDWLIDAQTAPEGHCSPIGNGWWPYNGTKSQFDQQPIEATSLLLAAAAAYRVTGEPRYRDAMEGAYGWFLGANDLGVPIADPVRGGGADGLTAEGVNANEGAESTLAWLTAAEHIRELRRASKASRFAPGRDEAVLAKRPAASQPATAARR